MYEVIKQNIELVKLIMERVIKKDDLCIDATLGNGNDTSCMLSLGARVFSFDIQKEAIDSSKNRLIEEFKGEDEIIDKVKLIRDSHENIDKYLSNYDKENKNIKFATFNLGYLPKGDKSIITKAPSTIKAIEVCTKYLALDGVISIVIYYEHEGGVEEKNDVEKYLINLNEDEFEVVCLNKFNSTKKLPITYFIYRK